MLVPKISKNHESSFRHNWIISPSRVQQTKIIITQPSLTSIAKRKNKQIDRKHTNSQRRPTVFDVTILSHKLSPNHINDRFSPKSLNPDKLVASCSPLLDCFTLMIGDGKTRSSCKAERQPWRPQMVKFRISFITYGIHISYIYLHLLILIKLN